MYSTVDCYQTAYLSMYFAFLFIVTATIALNIDVLFLSMHTFIIYAITVGAHDVALMEGTQSCDEGYAFSSRP